MHIPLHKRWHKHSFGRCDIVWYKMGYQMKERNNLILDNFWGSSTKRPTPGVLVNDTVGALSILAGVTEVPSRSGNRLKYHRTRSDDRYLSVAYVAGAS